MSISISVFPYFYFRCMGNWNDIMFPLQGASVLTMEWIDGVRCTDPAGIRAAGVDVDNFIRVGVMSGLRQLLEFGLFHGDPHPVRSFVYSRTGNWTDVVFYLPFTG